MINESFKAIFSTMSEREIYVLARRFGLGGYDAATLQDIGEEKIGSGPEVSPQN